MVSWHIWFCRATAAAAALAPTSWTIAKLSQHSDIFVLFFHLTRGCDNINLCSLFCKYITYHPRRKLYPHYHVAAATAVAVEAEISQDHVRIVVVMDEFFVQSNDPRRFVDHARFSTRGSSRGCLYMCHVYKIHDRCWCQSRRVPTSWTDAVMYNLKLKLKLVLSSYLLKSASLISMHSKVVTPDRLKIYCVLIYLS